MSMHKKQLTPTEEAGLRAHGLGIGTPSQLSDAFRQGVAWGEAAEREHQQAVRDAITALIEAARPIIRKPVLTSEESALYDAVLEAKRLIDA